MSETMALQLDVMSLRSRWPKDLPFRDALVTMMRTARKETSWTTDEEGYFKVACGVALLEAVDEDKEWLKDQLRIMQGLAGLFAAAAAGATLSAESLSGLAGGAIQRDYQLRKLWEESIPQKDTASAVVR